MPKPMARIDINDRDDRDGRNWFTSHMNRFPLLDGLLHEQTLRTKIEDGVSAHQRLMAGDLSPRERRQLEEVAAIGAGAFETMYECNLRWVMKIANKFPLSPAFGRMDIVQEGCKGLRRAIQKYNPAYGFKFSTYSEKWIRQGIQRGMIVTAYDLSLPAHAVQSGKDVKNAIENARRDDGVELTDKQLLKLGFTEDIIRVGRHIMFTQRFSLDKPLNDDGDMEFYDLMGAVTEDFEESTSAIEYRDAIAQYVRIADLDYREKMMLSIRKGIPLPGINYDGTVNVRGLPSMTLGELLLEVRGTGLELTLDEVGDVVGLTRERVRQVLAEADQKILKNISLVTIAQRLNLDEEEQKAFDKYFNFSDLEPGRLSAEHQRQRQAWGMQALSLLDLLDTDLEGALEKTVQTLVSYHAVTPLARSRIEPYLQVRYGLVTHVSGRLPYLKKDAGDMFELSSTQTLLADAVMLANIAGIWGKLPKEVRIAS